VTLSIRSNIASINAQRQLALQSSAREVTIQRTSSGQRINSAKDDAAGLSISSRLTSKVRGYTQAARNTNEAISFALTAEAGLQSSANVLQRIRELTVQAGNSAISRSDRAALSNEVRDLIVEIQGVTDTSRFNNKKLLDGSAQDVNFLIGAKASEGLSVSISSVAPSDLGQRSLDSSRVQGTTTISTAIAGSATNTFAGNGLAAQTLTITSGDSGPITGGDLQLASSATAKQIAAAINGRSDLTGVTAQASTTATLSNFTNLGAVQFTLFGKNTGAVAITGNINSTSNLGSLAAVINSKSAQTGITAAADQSGNLVLTEASGNDIGIKNQGGVGVGLNSVLFRGADVVLPNGSVVAGATVSFADASGANTIQTGGSVTLNGPADFSVTTTAAGTLFQNATSVSAFTALAEIDLSTAGATADALKTIDAAIQSVNVNIGAIGSLQTRLDKLVGQLQTQTGAADAARSRISDSDYANETARLTRSAILQQAATSVMTQANAQARNVLTLLKF
jgi:flagellin